VAGSGIGEWLRRKLVSQGIQWDSDMARLHWRLRGQW
jgi:hypothetical protein